MPRPKQGEEARAEDAVMLATSWLEIQTRQGGRAKVCTLHCGWWCGAVALLCVARLCRQCYDVCAGLGLTDSSPLHPLSITTAHPGHARDLVTASEENTVRQIPVCTKLKKDKSKTETR